MAIQYSVADRTNKLTQLATDIGTNAQIKIYSGSPPATVATAFTGTLLATCTGNATQFGTASAGVLTASAITNGTAAATGTAGYFRIATSGGTDHVQGTVYPSSTLTTSAATAANSNVLTFSAVSGVSVGQAVSGTGIPANATVIATSGTTVTLSVASTAGVSISTVITFSGDMVINNTSIASGQTVSISSLTITGYGA